MSDEQTKMGKLPAVKSVLLVLAIGLIVPMFSGCFMWGQREQDSFPQSVQVDWLGHSTFRLREHSGMALTTNPFDPDILNYPVPKDFRADAVLISHESSEANHIDLLRNSPQIVRSQMGVGLNRASGMLIEGVRYSSASSYTGDTTNIAYKWKMSGVRFAHLGAPQELVDRAALSRIGNVDVLFIPVGTNKLFLRQDYDAVIRELRPSIIVPMSFRTKFSSKMVLPDLESWLSDKPQEVRFLNGQSFSVSTNRLPAAPLILVPEIP